MANTEVNQNIAAMGGGADRRYKPRQVAAPKPLAENPVQQGPDNAGAKPDEGLAPGSLPKKGLDKDNSAQAGQNSATPSDEKKPDSGSKSAEVEYFENIQLPYETVVEFVENNVSTPYTVTKYLGAGNFGNTYLVRVAGQTLVLKEFCMRGARRQKTGADAMKIDFSTAMLNGHDVEPETLNVAMNKFRHEPDRVLKYLHDGPEIEVTPGYDLDKTREEAVSKLGRMKSGYFKWGNGFYSTYKPEQAQKMNLALPYSQCFEWRGNLYYVMEKAEGTTLFDYKETLNESNAELDLEYCLKIMEQLAVAVTNIHRTCIHMDLSPANVIFKQADGHIVLKVIDFGMAADLAKIRNDIEQGMDHFGSIVLGGTPGFSDMVENFKSYQNNPKDYHLVDIYSLGAILFFLVFFRKKGDLNATVQQHLGKELLKIHKDENRNYLPCPVNPKDRSDQANTGRILNQCFKLVCKATTSKLDERISSAKAFLAEIRKMMTRVELSKDMLNQASSRYERNQQWDDRVVHVHFTATGNWNAKVEFAETPEEPWLNSMGKTQGMAGHYSLTYNLSPNKSDTSREARIVICSNYFEREVVVTQASKPIIEEEPKIEFFPSGVIAKSTFNNGREQCDTITVIANNDWNASVHYSGEEGWIDLVNGKGQRGTHQVQFNVKPNESDKERHAEIVFSCAKCSIKWLVCQDGTIPPSPPKDWIIPKSALSLSFDWDAQASQGIAFACNKDWIAEVLDNPKWILLSDKKGKAGDIQLRIGVEKNRSLGIRSGVIRITAGTATLDVKVSQKGLPLPPPEKYIKALSSTSLIFTHNGNTSKCLDFECNGDWRLQTVEGEDWLVLDKQQGSKGSHSVGVKAKENMTTKKRIGKVVATCGDSCVTYSICQLGKTNPDLMVWIVSFVCFILASGVTWYFIGRGGENYTLDIKAGQHLTLSHEGGNQLVSLDASHLWDAKVVETQPDQWLKTDKAAGDKDKHDFVLVAEKNQSYENKTATVLVTCGDVSKRIHVIQGYDRTDSLSRSLEKFTLDPDKAMKITTMLKNFAKSVSVKEADENTDAKKSIPGIFSELIFFNPNIRIGKTHRVVDFKQDSKGKINEITIQKLK